MQKSANLCVASMFEIKVGEDKMVAMMLWLVILSLKLVFT